MSIAPAPGPDQVIGVGDDVRAIVRTTAAAREWVCQDRIAGHRGEPGEGSRDVRVILRAGDDQASLDATETRGQVPKVDHGQGRPTDYGVDE